LTLFIFGVMGWALIESLQAFAHGCMEAMGGSFLFWLVVIPMAISGIMALGITIALFRQWRRGAVLALIYDVLTGGLALLSLILADQEYVSKGGGEFAETMMVAAMTSALVLLTGAGSALLLAGCYAWKKAWWGFAVLVALTLALVAWPPLMNLANIQHVRVVRSYLATHLLRIPPETPVEVMRISDGRGGHHDDIRFHMADYCWITWPGHGSDGWHLQDHVAWGVLTKENLPRIDSEAEARKFLLRFGVTASDLGACTATSSNYCFNASTAAHYYEVTRDNGVHLFLTKPLVIPDH
jgi:hypothetical protein